MKSEIRVLVKSFKTAFEEIEYDRFNFPAGEIHVRLKDINSEGLFFRIEASILDSEGIMELLLLSNAIDLLRPRDKTLCLNYFPYGRQDRAVNTGEAFSLKVFADLINSCNFRLVYSKDPHSNVTGLLINNFIDTNEYTIIGKTPDVLIAPDAGASKRTFEFSKRFNIPMVQALKVRDPATGEIVSTEVHGDVDKKVCLIVDDICDGGRTFIELAKVLYKKGAKEVNLQVTHGLFSKGKAPLYQAGIINIESNFDYSERINGTT